MEPNSEIRRANTDTSDEKGTDLTVVLQSIKSNEEEAHRAVFWPGVCLFPTMRFIVGGSVLYAINTQLKTSNTAQSMAKVIGISMLSIGIAALCIELAHGVNPLARRRKNIGATEERKEQNDDIAEDSSCIQENEPEFPSCIDQAIASPSAVAAANESSSHRRSLDHNATSR